MILKTIHRLVCLATKPRGTTKAPADEALVQTLEIMARGSIAWDAKGKVVGHFVVLVVSGHVSWVSAILIPAALVVAARSLLAVLAPINFWMAFPQVNRALDAGSMLLRRKSMSGPPWQRPTLAFLLQSPPHFLEAGLEKERGT